MTAQALLERLAREGVAVRLDGGDVCLKASPPRKIDGALVAEVRANKAEIVALLAAKRQAKVTVSAAVRERSYPLPEPKVCDFLIGAPGENCRRCGASWLEHFTLGENAKRPGDRAL